MRRPGFRLKLGPVKRRLPLACLLLASVSLRAAAEWSEDKVLVGVYFPKSLELEVLFEKRDGGDWCGLFRHYQEGVDELKAAVPLKTAVTYDGRVLGVGEMRDNVGFNLEDVSNEEAIRSIAKRGRALPLVATSRFAKFSDPDRWKPAGKVAQAEEDALERYVYDSLTCIEKNERKRDAGRAEIRKAYRNKSGELLLRYAGTHTMCAPDGMAADLIEQPWIYFPKGAAPRQISWERELVDAGDYDGDGKSELLFAEGPRDDGRRAGQFELVYGPYYSQKLRVTSTGMPYDRGRICPGGPPKP